MRVYNFQPAPAQPPWGTKTISKIEHTVGVYNFQPAPAQPLWGTKTISKIEHTVGVYNFQPAPAQPLWGTNTTSLSPPYRRGKLWENDLQRKVGGKAFDYG